MARNNMRRIPIFSIQYYEYDAKVESPVEITNLPLSVDGLFDSDKTSRLCLGYMVNLKRKQQTKECLANIAWGIEFNITDDDSYNVRSFTKQPIYIMLKSSEEQIQLNAGETKILFNLTNLYNQKVVPKKIPKQYDEYSIKVSFGEPFVMKPFTSLDAKDFASPCWIQMNLSRISSN